jgi:hypothetical protein
MRQRFRECERETAALSIVVLWTYREATAALPCQQDHASHVHPLERAAHGVVRGAEDGVGEVRASEPLTYTEPLTVSLVLAASFPSAPNRRVAVMADVVLRHRCSPADGVVAAALAAVGLAALAPLAGPVEARAGLVRPPVLAALALAGATYGATTEPEAAEAAAGDGRNAAVAAKRVWKRRHSFLALALSSCDAAYDTERRRQLVHRRL